MTNNNETCDALDTLRVLLDRFFPVADSTVYEYMILDLPELAWSLRFLWPKLNFLNNFVTELWSTEPSLFAEQIPEVNYIARSFVQFSNHTGSEGMRNASTLQLTERVSTAGGRSAEYTHHITASLPKQVSWTLKNLMVLFTNPSARAGYDTRSIFKRSLTGFNSEFSFS